ncbi:MAG: patatin-like phospholipase family protein [Gammaproteobacteria bacterium]|nr:patatin-like phospholipase family protein [Gammaproteobacteria bacterium]
MSYTVLARKWRPRRFEELVGQQHVVKALVSIRRIQLIKAVSAVVALASMTAAGCQAPQRLLTQADLLAGHDDFLRAYQADLTKMADAGEARIDAEYQRALASSSERQSYDVLVLSGGGAFGAFGAGFLEGWGQVLDEEFARPEFDSVSGISTGALIAPFAFSGTPDAYRRIIELYENPEDDWVRRRGVIPFLPRNISLLDVSELQANIRSAITAELVQAVAEGAAEGRQLLVGATNADYGLMRVWDLAQTALSSSTEQAAERITSVLLASSAIPGAFPPVLIDGYLYVDGGASMQVVGGLEERAWAYFPDAASLESPVEGPPIRIRVWVIVNQKLLPDPEVVQPSWVSIAARSLSTLTRTSTLQSIQDAETYVGLIDQLPGFDARMRYVAIPQDYEFPETNAMFAAETMRDLADLGRRMGSDPGSWRTEALRPGAPFRLEDR